MKRYVKVIIAVVAVIAAILVPLALISGAVNYTASYSEYQIASTPVATVERSNLESDSVKVSFSIDRSNMVISSAPNTDVDSETKYLYIDNYLIWLIDMDAYNKAVEGITGSEVVNITTYKDREIEILGDTLKIDGVEAGTIQLEKNEVFVKTGDTSIQEDKTYYEQDGNDYKEIDLKAGTVIEKGTYYEKVENTTFSFTINKLYSKHGYAVGIQFYYSPNDINNTLYNKNLQERIEFITK